MRRLHRLGVVALIVGAFLGVGAAPASADSTPGQLYAPADAQGQAAFILDAAGDLGLQCGIGKLADKLRPRTLPLAVATRTAQAALAAAKAKRSCASAVKAGATAVAILAIAETGTPVYIEIDHAKKFKFPVWRCTENIRVGTSRTAAAPFKIDYTCW